MTLQLKSFLILYICILSFAFIIFLIAFLILEFLMRNKEVDKYAKEKNIKDLVKKFHKKLDDVNNQKTNEILECLKEMEKLDNIYYIMVDNNYNVMREEAYINVKDKILNRIIENKIKRIKTEKNKKEKYKSLLDELNVCQKRYPLYKNIYYNNIINIKEKI